jgi:hypothetical protein
MLRKIGLVMVCAGSLFASASMAMNHELAPSMTVEYELASQKPELFTNYTMFTINAICTIQASHGDYAIHVKAIRGSGAINGQSITAGDSLDIIVKNDDKMNLKAVSTAQVELTNTGNTTIKAVCKTV